MGSTFCFHFLREKSSLSSVWVGAWSPGYSDESNVLTFFWFVVWWMIIRRCSSCLFLIMMSFALDFPLLKLLHVWRSSIFLLRYPWFYFANLPQAAIWQGHTIRLVSTFFSLFLGAVAPFSKTTLAPWVKIIWAISCIYSPSPCWCYFARKI